MKNAVIAILITVSILFFFNLYFEERQHEEVASQIYWSYVNGSIYDNNNWHLSIISEAYPNISPRVLADVLRKVRINEAYSHGSLRQ